MKHRIVQVGSQFIIAGYENGRYVLDQGEAGAPPTGRNPRLLIAGLPPDLVYDNADAAAHAWRQRFDDSPVWDLYNEGPPDGTAISLGEASRSLGIDPATLRNQIHNRSLAGYKIGRNWVITDTELERYRNENLGATGRKPNRKS